MAIMIAEIIFVFSLSITNFWMNYSHAYVYAVSSVYFRLASPRHGFTIMNRLSMENLTEPITKDLDFQLQDPFLLYRNARCKEKDKQMNTQTHFLYLPVNYQCLHFSVWYTFFSKCQRIYCWVQYIYSTVAHIKLSCFYSHRVCKSWTVCSDQSVQHAVYLSGNQ